jgi:tetratricopeptide (TPR) repeat protein
MIRRRKIFTVLAVVMLAACSELWAGDAGRESQFSIGSGARAVGMGGGFVGLADDASAIYWNQSALSLLDNQEMSLMHVTLFEGSMFDVASYVYPHHKLGGFGMSFMRLGTSEITRRADWEDLGEFSYSKWQLLLGYGRKLEGGYSLGSALKIVGQSMDNKSATGVALDISFYKAIYKNISAGLMFQDIVAPRLKLGNSHETYPMAINIGAGIKKFRWGKGFSHNIGLGLEKPEDRSLKLHLGFESIYRNYMALRAGFDRDNLSFGFGIFYQKFHFDYAYKFMDDLSDSHRLGLSLNIGASVSEKIQREKELESARGSDLILDDRRRQFQFFKDLGDRYYQDNSIDSAYIYYHRALAFNEEDQEARNKIAHIEDMRRSLSERARKEMTETDILRPVLDNYYSQAEQFAGKGAYASALELVDIALKASPDDQRLADLRQRIISAREIEIRRLMDAGSKAEREGKYAEALTSYNRILELSPENTAVKQLAARASAELTNAQLISKGVELFTLGNLSQARIRFEEAKKLNATNPVADEYLEKISSLMKEASDLEILQKDETAWRLYLSALEHFRNGDYETAIKLWEEVLKYYPGNSNTLNNIEQARLRLQKKE